MTDDTIQPRTPLHQPEYSRPGGSQISGPLAQSQGSGCGLLVTHPQPCTKPGHAGLTAEQILDNEPSFLSLAAKTISNKYRRSTVASVDPMQTEFGMFPKYANATDTSLKEESRIFLDLL